MIPIAPGFFKPTAAVGGTNNLVYPDAGSLIITGYAPTIPQKWANPGAGELILTGTAPSLRINNPITTGAGSLVLGGVSPSISVSGSYFEDFADSGVNFTIYDGPLASSPTVVVVAGYLSISQGSNTYELKVRMDDFPEVADCTIEADLRIPTDNLGYRPSAGLIGRTSYWRDDDGGYGWMVHLWEGNIAATYGTNSDSGTVTNAATNTGSWNATDTVHVKWTMSGDSHVVEVDGVEKLNFTSTQHQTVAGKVGIRLGRYNVVGTSTRVDNLSVVY